MSTTENSEVNTNDVPVTTSTSNTTVTTVGVISTTTPDLKSQDVCIAEGCNNAAVQHPEWDNEYCSVSCTYKHCKATFLDWLANNRYAKLKAKQADPDQVNSAATPNEEQSTTT
ncbi:PREDICTED: TOX high mobility group box family member 4-A-like [Diuraphis noxia]|uniref:TOX high mobility group box family member 4-A-like n=1 Tax=Diuraphis noxia TaxID=143948 RepID=UPI000763B3EC|nr:PREDICTED: TOX high mobility group box family member 4-A-like [Diuraphis noxia]